MLVFAIILLIVEVIIRLHQPYFVALLLRFFSDAKKKGTKFDIPNAHSPTYIMRIYNYHKLNQSLVTMHEAEFYAAGVCIISYIYIFVQNPYYLGVMHLGMKIRVGICSLIYRKALKLTRASMSRVGPGQIVNLMSNDVLRLDNAPMYLHYLWISPLQAIFITYLLYREIGSAALYGAMAAFIFIPFQIMLGCLTLKIRRNTAAKTDERVRQMNEIIRGIQVIKMYTWEFPFVDLIRQCRKNEVYYIRQSAYLKGVMMSFIMFTARSGIFFSVLFYIIRKHNITTEQMFLITSHYLILRQTMTTNFPQAVTACAEAYVALKRIQAFLREPDSDTAGLLYEDPNNRRSTLPMLPPSVTLVSLGVQLRHVYARWTTRGKD